MQCDTGDADHVRTSLLQGLVVVAALCLQWVIQSQADAAAHDEQQHDQLKVRVRADLRCVCVVGVGQA